MKHVIDPLKNFTRDESGTTALEYGPLVAWVAWVALIITVGTTALGAELGLFFGRIATRLSTTVGAASKPSFMQRNCSIFQSL